MTEETQTCRLCERSIRIDLMEKYGWCRKCTLENSAGRSLVVNRMNRKRDELAAVMKGLGL